MVNISLKQVAFLGAGTTVVGGGLITTKYFLLNDNSINKEILKENKKLLDINADNAYWEIKLSSYIRDEKNKNNLGLKEDKVNYLKEWCVNTLKSKFSNKEDKNYKSAKALCLFPTNKEKLLKENKKLATSTHWTGKESSYKLQDNQNLIQNISKTEVSAKNIEDWCNLNIEKDFNNREQSLYILTLKWCTQEGA